MMLIKKDILPPEVITQLINDAIKDTESMQDAFTKLAVDTQYHTIGKMYSDEVNLVTDEVFNYVIVLAFHKGEYELVDFSGKTFKPKSMNHIKTYFKQVIPTLGDKLKNKLNITDGVYLLTSLGCFVESNEDVVFVNINPLAAFEITAMETLAYILDKSVKALNSKFDSDSLLYKHFNKE